MTEYALRAMALSRGVTLLSGIHRIWDVSVLLGTATSSKCAQSKDGWVAFPPNPFLLFGGGRPKSCAQRLKGCGAYAVAVERTIRRVIHPFWAFARII